MADLNIRPDLSLPISKYDPSGNADLTITTMLDA